MDILVVEDDVRVARFLVRGLKEEGYQVVHCSNGATALETGLAQTFHLILLDWSLPDMDGLTILNKWRALGVTTPVIIITARTGIDNTILGLDAGADDFIEKPFSFEELLARIRANARRHQLSGGKVATKQQIVIGEATIELNARQIKNQDQVATLSNREFHLLSYLLKHRGEVLSRSRILDRVWGMSHDPTTNVVDVYIRYLRDKLDSPEARASGESVIETLRGRGYRLKAGD